MPDPIDLGYALPYLSAAFLGGYVLGSFPTGWVLTRFAGLGDIRAIGSGNIGATNVLRTGNKWISAGTLLGDAGKGALAVWCGGQFGLDMAILAGAGAFFGHLFPVWLKFHGGKGVAVFAGILTILYWPLALFFAAVWAAMAIVFRFSSAAALAASITAPLAAALIFDEWQIAEMIFLLQLFIVWTHRENIMRLAKGTEPKIGQKS